MTIIAPILRVSRGLLNNSAHHLLRLILRRMRQRAFVLEHLAEIAAVDPAAATRASDVMLGLVLGRHADWPADIGAPGDRHFGGSLWASSGHSLSTTTRVSSEMIDGLYLDEIVMKAPQ